MQTANLRGLHRFSRPQGGLKTFLQLIPRSRMELHSVARKREKMCFDTDSLRWGYALKTKEKWLMPTFRINVSTAKLRKLNKTKGGV